MASFFQRGFKGAVKQFNAQGYLSPEEDVDFLDYQAALLKYPLDVFDL